MKIECTLEGTRLTVRPEGRLDTLTAPELKQALEESWEGATEIILDLAGVDFVSSAGIRIILMAHKHMADHGSLVIQNVRDSVAEVFELTGLTDTLNFA